MIQILKAIILTFSLLTAGIITKKMLKPYQYIFAFLFYILIILMFDSKLHAAVLQSRVEIKHLELANIRLISISKEDKRFYRDKVKFHKENAERCYNDAKDRCFLIPDFDDRRNAEFCLVTAGTLLLANDPRSKIIAITIDLLIYYGLNMIDEWNYIQNKLHWAEYHMEMMEFYQSVLVNA
jgi:hypothetical protein